MRAELLTNFDKSWSFLVCVSAHTSKYRDQTFAPLEDNLLFATFQGLTGKGYRDYEKCNVL